jgi:hypothetical protein
MTAGTVNFSLSVGGSPVCMFDAGTEGRFSGRVTGIGGAGVANATVTAINDFAGFRLEADETETDQDGFYLFDCLQPGTYVARATAPGTNLLSEYFEDTDSANADLFNALPNVPVTNVNFSLVAGGRISGRVTVQGTSTGIGNASVTARNVDTGELFNTSSAPNGDYILGEDLNGGIPLGDYVVWVADHSTADFTLVPVVLSRFEALEVEDGIAIEWDVTGDHDVSGFHVYRSDDALPAPLRLTEYPISGRGEGRFVDREAPEGSGLLYWLGVLDREGREERFGPVAVRGGVTPIRTQLFTPDQNPLRESSDIRFSLARPGRVTVRIHDLSGRLVKTLVDADRPAGIGSVRWDARRDDGRKAAGGVYYVKFESGPVVESTKLVLAR